MTYKFLLQLEKSSSYTVPISVSYNHMIWPCWRAQKLVTDVILTHQKREDLARIGVCRRMATHVL